MKTINQMFALIVCITLVACSANTQYLKKSYENKNYTNQKIGLVQISPQDVNVVLTSHYIDDFGEITGQTIDEHAAKLLSEKTTQIFKNKIKNGHFQSSNLVFPVLNDSNSTVLNANLAKVSKASGIVSIRVPNKSLIESVDPELDFLIVISDVKFDYEKSMMMGGNQMPTGHSALKLSYQYAIKNIKEDEFVGYGIASSLASANYFIEKADWLKLMEDAASAVIEKSPF